MSGSIGRRRVRVTLAALVVGLTAPSTVAFAQAKKDGAHGFAFRAATADHAGVRQELCEVVYGFGGRWSDEAGKLTLDSPKVVEGVNAYKTMHDAGSIPKGTNAATSRRIVWDRRDQA